MSSLCKKPGARIKEIRESKGIRQVKLAELINMEPSNLSKLENGNQFPKEENLEKIANILDVSISDLFNFEHKLTQSELICEINTIVSKLPKNKLEFLYSVLINLKYIK